MTLQAGFGCISPATVGFRKADFPRLARLTKRWDTVYIINDNEEGNAGEQGALSTAQYLFEQKIEARLVQLPRPDGVDKIDLADFLNVPEGQQDARIAELRELMANAPDFIEWEVCEADCLPNRRRPKAVSEIAALIAHLDEGQREPYKELVVDEKKLTTRRALNATVEQARIEKVKSSKANRMKEAEEKLSPEAFLRLQIEDIRKGKQKTFSIKRAVSNLILGDMRERGKFYQTATGQLYWFDNEVKELHQIGQEGLGVHINHSYGINQSEAEYEFLTSDLKTEAAVKGQETEVQRFAFYDKGGHALYIFNNANQIYRLNGESVELVDNGTDGNLFVGNPLHEPFTYECGVSDKIHALVVDPIPFVDGNDVNLSSDEQKRIFSAWLCTLFFESLQPTKPLQFFLGAKGAGKTTKQRIIGQWLFGKKFDVMPINMDKEDSFVSAVTNNSFSRSTT